MENKVITSSNYGDVGYTYNINNGVALRVIKLDVNTDNFLSCQSQLLKDLEQFDINDYKTSLLWLHGKLHDIILGIEEYFSLREKLTEELNSINDRIKRTSKYGSVVLLSYFTDLSDDIQLTQYCISNLAVLEILGCEDLIITFQQSIDRFYTDYRQYKSSGWVDSINIRTFGHEFREMSMYDRTKANFEYLKILSDDFKNLELGL